MSYLPTKMSNKAIKGKDKIFSLQIDLITLHEGLKFIILGGV